MPAPRPEALRLGALFRIAVPQAPRSGPAGERLGRGTGASLEFQDRQPYAAGDDLRHLDWRVYARTDQLWVRQYREEIQPRLDLIADATHSMAIDAAKAQLLVDLCALLAVAGESGGFDTRVWLLRERPQQLEIELLKSGGFTPDAQGDVPRAAEEVGGMLRRGSLRVLLSDALFEHDPRLLLRPLAATAGGFAVVQILAPEDLDPPEGAFRLTDAESGQVLDLVLETRVVAEYRRRLERLCEGLERECQRAAGRYLRLVAGASLEVLCRSHLVPRLLEL